MRINTNVAALNSYNQLKGTNDNMNKSLERLSSGKRINSAADDAAGLAISQKMKGQMNGLSQAQSNAQDSVSMIQTAEGALKESQSILQRMRELSVQSANDTNTADDRAEIQEEVDELKEELDNIGETTEFNTKKLLNGGAGLETNVDYQNTSGAADTEGEEWMSIQGGTSDTQEIEDVTIGTASAAAGGEVTFTTTGTAQTDSETISINGNSIEADVSANTAADNAQNIVDAINENSDEIGATAATSGDDVEITNEAVGSANELEVSAGSSVVSGGTALDDSASGTDANITGGDSVIADADKLRSGNSIEITSGSLKGLKLDLDGEAMSATADNNEAQFDINSNNTVRSHIGANEGQNMNISINDMRSEALGVNDVDVTSADNADEAIGTLDDAIQKVSGERSKLGAKQNRLEHVTNNLSAAEENLTAANSRIEDVDMAKEMMDMSKSRILSQAGTAMLAQANQKSQGVMQLLG